MHQTPTGPGTGWSRPSRRTPPGRGCRFPNVEVLSGGPAKNFYGGRAPQCSPHPKALRNVRRTLTAFKGAGAATTQDRTVTRGAKCSRGCPMRVPCRHTPPPAPVGTRDHTAGRTRSQPDVQPGKSLTDVGTGLLGPGRRLRSGTGLLGCGRRHPPTSNYPTGHPVPGPVGVWCTACAGLRTGGRVPQGPRRPRRNYTWGW